MGLEYSNSLFQLPRYFRFYIRFSGVDYYSPNPEHRGEPVVVDGRHLPILSRCTVAREGARCLREK
jgi:hypothetical protein